MTVADRRWRWALTVIAMIAALFFVLNISSGSLTASEGLDFRIEPTRTPYLGRVLDVRADSPAQTAGLRNGDVIPFKKLGNEERYRLLSGVYGHERLTIPVMRNGASLVIKYMSGAAVPQTRWDLVLSDIAVVWQLMFAMLLAWRAPHLREARALSVFLSVNSLGGFFAPGNWASTSAIVDVLLAAFAYATQAVATALLAYYAALFALPLSLMRRVLTVLSYGSAIVGFAAAVSILVGAALGVIDPFAFHPLARLVIALSFAFPLLALFSAVAASRGTERSRVLWTTIGLTPLIVANIPYVYASGVLGTANIGYSLWTQLANVGEFLAPVGISYALLNRRLLDIGFALNRAAVYTAVSVVVVGTFVLVEFALTEWLGASRNANLLAGALLALLLGFSMRYIHARVDSVLDTVFFKKRHEDEQAIRAFAHEVAFITDASTIRRRFVSLLEARAEAAWADLALVDDTGNYGSAEENDPAIVRLRAWHKRVDLHGMDSALAGDFAFPLVSRARLIGVLTVGPKRSGDAYAPDESDAIANAAHAVALALDMLTGQATVRNEILDAIHQSNQRIMSAIGHLNASSNRVQ